MQTEFIIHAAPQGKARPRITRFGAYTPKRTHEYEAFIREEYRKQSALYFGKNPLNICVVAYYQIPKNTSKGARQKMLDGDVAPNKKPDLDNVLKVVLDALNGIAYDDDKQIVTIYAEKRYADEAKVLVRIMEK